MFVIARKGGALTKQSLFASTIGSAARLVSRHRRLLRTLRALAMTDLGSPKEKVDPTVFGDYPIIGQSCAMTSYSRHCEEYSKVQGGNFLVWFLHSRLFPMFVITRKGGALTKQSLFASTPGRFVRLVPRDRRLLWTLRVLAMTGGGPEIATGPFAPSQ